ncbi:MAG: hypothetical protein J0H78_15360 [Rhizobiales bacterium]|nr:hypothetical protein [Hyphomicrobiales bacterium]OJY43726.1 MAG: hypothetical protein BGP08_09380 [Rhizobiales bacterium 64-17]
MRNLDFTSWQSLLITLIGLALFTLISIGIRLLMMVTIQQRRERMNRQINERLRTLIAAYKVLGGSFTGDLTVDPAHLRDLRRAGAGPAAEQSNDGESSDRRRRIRDAVEAALADIILLGTEEQVRFAGRAANDLIAGRPVHTDELVTSLRTFIREALDLDAVPVDLTIPPQGPARPSSANRGKGERDGAKGGGRGGGMGMGGGTGMGVGLGSGAASDDAAEHKGG